MTKADIVNEVAKATGLEKLNVQKVVEAFMETVKDSVSKDNSVYLRGFGSFTAKKRAQKTFPSTIFLLSSPPRLS